MARRNKPENKREESTFSLKRKRGIIHPVDKIASNGDAQSSHKKKNNYPHNKTNHSTKSRALKPMIGRPTLYDAQYHPQAAYTVCASLGASNKHLAELFQVNCDTIAEWKIQHSQFSEALDKGKDFFDRNHVENKLLDRINGYEIKAEKTRETLDQDGNPIELKSTETQFIPPDTRAIMYWLNNRHPNRWSLGIQNVNIRKEERKEIIHRFDFSNLPDEEIIEIKNMASRLKLKAAEIDSKGD